MANKRVKTVFGERLKLSALARKRTCAYIRVSTGHEEQLVSFENQTKYYEQKLRSSPEYEYAGIYSDASISGGKANRPGFQAMMEAARRGEVDVILTKSISRFARNTVLLLESVRELKALGVAVIFEEQGINTLEAEGELLLSLLASIADEERKSVSENIRWSVRKRYQRGDAMINADRLLGYDTDGDGKLVVNREQAKIVRQIYRRYLAGDTPSTIAQKLNEANTPTFTRYPWSGQRILRIIANERNVGDCLMQKTFIDQRGKQIKNRGYQDQFFVKNHHPAIISRIEWEAAQEIRKEREKKVYPFTSKLLCPFCGAILIRVTAERRWVSWVCATYLHQGKSACVGMRIPDHRLQELSQGMPITERMVLEEVPHGGGPRKKREKDYRFVPASEYAWPR